MRKVQISLTTDFFLSSSTILEGTGYPRKILIWFYWGSTKGKPLSREPITLSAYPKSNSLIFGTFVAFVVLKIRWAENLSFQWFRAFSLIARKPSGVRTNFHGNSLPCEKVLVSKVCYCCQNEFSIYSEDQCQGNDLVAHAACMVIQQLPFKAMFRQKYETNLYVQFCLWNFVSENTWVINRLLDLCAQLSTHGIIFYFDSRVLFWQGRNNWSFNAVNVLLTNVLHSVRYWCLFVDVSLCLDISHWLWVEYFSNVSTLL